MTLKSTRHPEWAFLCIPNPKIKTIPWKDGREGLNLVKSQSHIFGGGEAEVSWILIPILNLVNPKVPFLLPLFETPTGPLRLGVRGERPATS